MCYSLLIQHTCRWAQSMHAHIQAADGKHLSTFLWQTSNTQHLHPRVEKAVHITFSTVFVPGSAGIIYRILMPYSQGEKQKEEVFLPCCGEGFGKRCFCRSNTWILAIWHQSKMDNGSLRHACKYSLVSTWTGTAENTVQSAGWS